MQWKQERVFGACSFALKTPRGVGGVSVGFIGVDGSGCQVIVVDVAFGRKQPEKQGTKSNKLAISAC